MLILESGASEIELRELTGVFRLLADMTRLKIVLLLASGERNVTRLCEELHLPQPTVSHHLGLLRMKGIVGNRRDGKQIFYKLDSRVIAESGALRIAMERFSVAIEVSRDAGVRPAITEDGVTVS